MSRTVAATVLYFTAAFVLFGIRVLGAFGESYIGGNGPDPKLFIWSLAWWSGPAWKTLNPFHANAIWAPGGFDLTWATTVPAPGVLIAPITKVFGPVAGYNTLVLLAITLAGTTAFVLCYVITTRFLPAFLGGCVFGFSSYMLAHLRGGHLNLILVFALPLVAVLVLARIAGRLRTRRFIVLLASLLALQFYISTEVFATLSLMMTLALGVAYFLASTDLRQAIAATVPSVLVAYGVVLVVATPFLIAAFVGPLPVQVIDTSVGSTDLVNLFVPTPITWIGGRMANAVSASFAGAVSGQGAYFGIPMVFVAVAFVRQQWHSYLGRILTAFLLVATILSFGSWLRIMGAVTIPLPGQLLDVVPLVSKALPGRLIMYASLTLSVIVAVWLRQPNKAFKKYLIVVAGIVFLLPTPKDWVWRSTPQVPAFFSEGRYVSDQNEDELSLVLARTSALPMVWQAIAEMHFRTPTAYTGGVPSQLADGPLASQYLYRQQCPDAALSPSVQALLVDIGVTSVIVPAAGREADGCAVPLVPGADLTRVDGVLIYRLRPSRTDRMVW